MGGELFGSEWRRGVLREGEEKEGEKGGVAGINGAAGWLEGVPAAATASSPESVAAAA